MLDEANSPMPVPLILYYPYSPKSPTNTTFETRIQLLKRSLSVILTRFYPLAGRIRKDGRSVECKDEGVPFIVAKIEGEMMTDSRYKQAQGPAETCLFPLEIRWDTELGPGDNVAMIQVSQFECGGIAIGVVFWHKVGDADMRQSLVECPTRVEVVSALIWRCFMAASLANNKSASLLTHAVNLRRKSQSPFTVDCFGNFGGMATASCTNRNEMDLAHLVRKIRDAISKVNDDYIARMLVDQGFLGYCQNLEETWRGLALT
ncbi:limonoid 7-O-acetyltransferse-like [Primulina eburnea]|uniref:limonoid 7-O-acetyltransferse-like n=1 Tax=Primulina eburnea TaxID=1245227 RepID=UPI003C6BF673